MLSAVSARACLTRCGTLCSTSPATSGSAYGRNTTGLPARAASKPVSQPAAACWYAPAAGVRPGVVRTWYPPASSFASSSTDGSTSQLTSRPAPAFTSRDSRPPSDSDSPSDSLSATVPDNTVGWCWIGSTIATFTFRPPGTGRTTGITVRLIPTVFLAAPPSVGFTRTRIPTTYTPSRSPISHWFHGTVTWNVVDRAGSSSPSSANVPSSVRPSQVLSASSGCFSLGTAPSAFRSASGSLWMQVPAVGAVRVFVPVLVTVPRIVTVSPGFGAAGVNEVMVTSAAGPSGSAATTASAGGCGHAKAISRPAPASASTGRNTRSP